MGGLKSDLRSDDNPGISMERITQYQNEAGCAGYVETSALKGKNIELAFQTAIQKFLLQDEKKAGATEEAAVSCYDPRPAFFLLWPILIVQCCSSAHCLCSLNITVFDVACCCPFK